jgi:AcrR family transcriptional regulator
MAMDTTDQASRERRPRNRRDQLAALAVDLFCRHGFHAVGVNDIASAAGVTGPALYRHFPGKQAVLAHVLFAGLDTVDAVVRRDLAGPGEPAERLRALTRSLATLAVEQRAVSTLWRKEGRHLSTEHRDELRRRGTRWMTRWTYAVRGARPELAKDDAELLCWAALSVFGSVADHHTQLPKRRFVPLLAALADDVLGTDLPPAAGGESPPNSAPALPPPTRREQLLASAAQLFRERGFHAVTMEDIGQATGMAAASVYRHFPSKAELLLAGCRRMADRLLMDAAVAIEGAADPATALDGLLRSYVDSVLRNRDLIAVYTSEVGNLPGPERAELIRLQRTYVAHWTRLRRAVDPHLDEPTARVCVHAALTIVNDLPRTGRLAGRPRLASEIAYLARRALAGPGGSAHRGASGPDPAAQAPSGRVEQERAG